MGPVLAAAEEAVATVGDAQSHGPSLAVDAWEDWT